MSVDVLAYGKAYVIEAVIKFAFRPPALSDPAIGAAPHERQRGKVRSQLGTTTIGHTVRGAAAPVTGEREPSCGHRHNCRPRVRSWRNPSAQRRSRVADGFGHGPFPDGKSCLRISDKLVRSACRRQSVPLGGPMPSSHPTRSLFGTHPAFSHLWAVEAGGCHAAR